jgi:hypothetical protein
MNPVKAVQAVVGARAIAEDLTWEREILRLDQSYREVCEVASVTRAVA